LILLELDAATSAHLAGAISRHFAWARTNGIRPPAQLLDLGEMCVHSARRGQAGTTIDGIASLLDAAAMSPPPLLVSYAESARLLGVGERTIKRMVADGALSPVRVGASSRIRRADLDSFVSRARFTDRVEIKAPTEGAA